MGEGETAFSAPVLSLSLLGFAIVMLAPLRLPDLPTLRTVIPGPSAVPPVGAGIVIAVDERPGVHDN